MILTMGLALTSSITFGAEDCEKGGQIGRLYTHLLQVASSAQSVPVNDKRKSIEELAQKAEKTEAERVAIRAAQSTVAIKSIWRNGQQINNYGYTHQGSGFLVGGGCFVATVRHVVNADEIKVINGKKMYVPSPESPTGSTVKMEIGFAPGQVREQAEGEVIFAGPAIDQAGHDVSVIRLNKKASAKSIPLGAPDMGQIAGAEMVSVGLPMNRQEKGSINAFADTNCQGANDGQKRASEGMLTSCLASPGDSGGPLLAKVDYQGRKTWVAVGAVAQQDINTLTTGSTLSEENASPLRAFLFVEYADKIEKVMQESLNSRPCE